MEIKSKLPDVGLTIFSHMSALAKAHDAVNLSQGFPDFAPDSRLEEAVRQAMAAGAHQYAPMPGHLGLRVAISDYLKDIIGASYSPDSEITVTAGATQALTTAILSLIDPGAEVILFAPAYDSYAPAVCLAGGIPITIPLTFPDYQIDWNRVREVMSQKTRMLVLNSPHNPSGRMLTTADLEALKDLAGSFEFVILSDEVYAPIVFDGRQHLSPAQMAPLADRTLVVGSFGKMYHITGWKIGFVAGPEKLMQEIRKVHQYNVFSVNSLLQEALAHYMPIAPWQELAGFYQKKRDLFLELTTDIPFKPLPCEGSYFQLMDYSQISDLSEVAFAEWLTREVGVAVIPLSVFYPDGAEHKVVRFCFAKKASTLEAAADRLRKRFLGQCQG
jgi:methionine aminotransferase